VREALGAGAIVTFGSAGRSSGGDIGADIDRWSRSQDSVRGHGKWSHIGTEATTGTGVRQT
jgi:hypothetical protein